MTTEPSSQGLAQRSVGLRGDWIASITNVAPTAATTLTMAALIGASGLGAMAALIGASGWPRRWPCWWPGRRCCAARWPTTG